jgi:hypothetical protein
LNASTTATPLPASARPRAAALPAEGENGLFSQSWYPICQSADIAVHQIKGFPFLDGRVIVARG